MSQLSAESQTAQDFIASQLQLEADAREALPYQFDTCTRPLGALKQSLFSCLTCNPPPASTNDTYTPAGVCYSCSISCHGEHELVELFTKRNFTCDCGSTRLPSTAPCSLRINAATSEKGGVTGEAPAEGNKYNQNYAGRFCGCAEQYYPEKEKGTMFQCLGLGHVQDGGCGEDWWHPECLMGLPRNLPTEVAPKAEKPKEDGIPGEEQALEEETPLPAGFPAEDDFDHFICYKCVDSNPWIKQYVGTPGFLGPVFHEPSTGSDTFVADTVQSEAAPSKKRSAEEEPDSTNSKKAKVDSEEGSKDEPATDAPATDASAIDAPVTEKPSTETTEPKHSSLSPAPAGSFSLFLKEDFRENFCRCSQCFPQLSKYPQLLEEEESYEPPMSESDDEDANGRASIGSGSTYERGEALLSNMDRVKAIEGVMAYNHIRDKVKAFLQPFAESGQAVGAEDIKAYFEKLRGDEDAIRLAGAGAGATEDKEN